MKVIVVTDQAAGTAGVKLVQRPEPRGGVARKPLGANPAIHYGVMDGAGHFQSGRTGQASCDGLQEGLPPLPRACKSRRLDLRQGLSCSPFEVTATFPLEVPRRLWAFALCQSRVKGVTQVMRRLALIMFSMTAAGVYVPASLLSPAFAFANDTSGAAVFKDHCTPCHGEDGKGKAPVGTPDFTSPKIQASLTDSEIMDIITNGKKGTIMPAWKGTLSPQEISAAASYVRSLGGGH